MLKVLSLAGVGPAPALGPITLAPRLNVFTGDNGLGKTLFLDLAWWALTGTWASTPAWPRPGYDNPTIRATVLSKTKEAAVLGTFDHQAQAWVANPGRPAQPGLVLYFRANGQFSLWDPAQHYWRRNKALGIDDPQRPDALHFGPNEVWEPIRSADGKIICRGLIEDWVTWQQTRAPEFDLLCKVLDQLSPSPQEPLRPGPPTPVWIDDIRLHPTLSFPYGDTPVSLASAGVQRIVVLAYLVVWAWFAHQRAVQFLRREPEQRLIILFDEPESHLHPEWQRRLLPALLQVTQQLSASMNTQVLVSTHAPLVLASVEPLFSDEDQLFHFYLQNQTPELAAIPFEKQGDATDWLVSEVFGLAQGRSVPAQEAILAAEAFMRGTPERNPDELRTVEQIHRRLIEVLGPLDTFWPRWLVQRHDPR